MKRTVKQKVQWYRKWKASGLTQAEFCKKHGLPPSSIRNWRDRTKAKNPSQFIPIKIAEPKPSTQHYTVRIGTCELDIPSNFDDNEVTRLIKAIGVNGL